MVTDDPALAETHISWVLMSGERALKIYKPVRTDVLDHRDLDQRRAACEREVELNRRLAPDVYEGVATIVLGDEVLEPVVVMRRMPASRRLAGLLGTDEGPRRVRDVARAVAAFHASLPPLAPEAAEAVASADGLGARWRDDVAGLTALVDDGWRDQAVAIGERADTYLAGRSALLAARIEAGMVRDGHGDLLAEDIFCLDDGPRILDCLAFCDELRWGDVLGDVAFLVMDLERLGHPGLGRSLLTGYGEFSGEHHPGSLAHLYVAQRALVRAKVAALRADQTASGAGTTTSDVEELLGLAIDHLRRAEVRLALVGGLPGSGKSTLAGRMADELGWVVVSSDAVRRDAGLRYRDLHDPSAYDPATVGRVYEAMRTRAAQLMAHGMSVILDATWTSAAERDRARSMADDARARVLEVRCHAPSGLCRARVGSRGDQSDSEATEAVVDLLAGRADPWPEAIGVDTSGTGDDAAAHGGRTSENRRRGGRRSRPPAAPYPYEGGVQVATTPSPSACGRDRPVARRLMAIDIASPMGTAVLGQVVALPPVSHEPTRAAQTLYSL